VTFFKRQQPCTIKVAFSFIVGLRSRDPLGKVIALILLTIFLLSLLTLCLRIFASSCTNSHKCCVIQCAVQVQCCCQWKAGRLRILPSGGRRSSTVADVTNETRSTTGARGRGTQQARRANLYPPPPPAYLEIFPEGDESGTYSIDLPNCTVCPKQDGFCSSGVTPRPDTTPQHGNDEDNRDVVIGTNTGPVILISNPSRAGNAEEEEEREAGGSESFSETETTSQAVIRFEEPDVLAADAGNRNEGDGSNYG
jgi:hypothetical protein